MRKSGSRIVVAVLGCLFLVAAGAPASAAPPDNARSEHDRVVAFWTNERVAKAIPRDFVYDPVAGRFVPSERARPGGGGGTSTTVTGKSWPGGDTAVDRTTGKVLFAMGDTYYVCSANVVTDPAGPAAERGVVMSAGHCVYDETGNAFATNWMFIPDYDYAPASLTRDQSFCVNTRYGCWVAQRLLVHNNYASASGFNADAIPYDVGYAVVGLGGKAGDVDVDAAYSQSVAFSTRNDGTVAHAFGYPASGKYRGNDLVYCAGPVGPDTVGGHPTYGLGCDMTGGSSGGPWFSDFNMSTGRGVQMSVNSYGYSGVKKMFGPKLGPEAEAVYTATGTGTANSLVG